MMNQSRAIFNAAISMGLMVLMTFTTAQGVALASAGKIIAADGKVEAVNVDKEVRPIKRGDDFYVQDTINTDEASTVSLRFTDGTLLELKEKSSFEIKNYQFKQDAPAGDSYSAELIKGGFRTITGALGQRNPDHYEVQARMTTLTIRGTEYVMNFSTDSDVQVGLLTGAATVSAGNNTVDLTPNTNAVIHANGYIVRAYGVPASMMHGYSSNNIGTLREQATHAGFSASGSAGKNQSDQKVYIEGEGSTKPPAPVGASSPCAGVAGMSGAM
ncbi:MAG: FecR domain-containing protein [Gammaproteobacteria bacterium]